MANNKEKFDLTFSTEVVYFPCVYFLMDGEEVVYVGQTCQGLKRVLHHMLDKQFDNIGIIRCDENSLDRIETKFIAKYSPKYNKTLTNAYSVKNIKSYLLKNKSVRVRIKKIESYIQENDIPFYLFKGNIYLDKENFILVIKHFANNEER